MKEAMHIALVLIPAGLVLITSYILVKRFLDRETRMHERDIREKLARVQEDTRKTILPMRLQAYERVILLLERISPPSMIMRIHSQNATARSMHTEMLKAVREEFEHNVTQQMYMSDKAWTVVVTAKEETIKILNSSFGRAGDNATATDYSQEVFRSLTALPKLPTEVALEMVKEEVRKLF
jgi:hypothetical protein